MSDEQEHEHGIPFIVPVPAEVMAQMQARQDHRQMEADEYFHSIARFFDSMDADQLATFERFLHAMVSVNEGSPGQASLAVYEGVASGLLHARHNICMACNRDHDKVMREVADNSDEPDTLKAMDGGDPFRPVEEKDAEIGSTDLLSSSQLINMNDYGLDDLREEGTGKLLGFICVNCGLKYVSIQDRMLRPPGKGGCSGCQQKEMWG